MREEQTFERLFTPQYGYFEHQSPQYPMQLMLNLYEIPSDDHALHITQVYPSEFSIDYVRCYQENGKNHSFCYEYSRL